MRRAGAVQGFDNHWRELADQLAALGVSGVGGAYFRAIVVPEQEWRKRVVQAVGGALSAVFLGGLVAHFINAIADAGVYSYLAAGFVMGSGGEVAVKKIQDRILGKNGNG